LVDDDDDSQLRAMTTADRCFDLHVQRTTASTTAAMDCTYARDTPSLSVFEAPQKIMARIGPSPAAQKRRREMMAAALERARASRLAAEAARVAVRSTDVAGRAREFKVTTWIREHGDANTMTAVSNDEIRRGGDRLWVIRCDACGVTLRLNSVNQLQRHAAAAVHTTAVNTARLPESKVVTWIREHGDANKMTLVSNDERSRGGIRVWVIRCDACGMTLRLRGPKDLQKHTDCAAHTAAVNTARRPESKVVAWMREHGDANKMTVLSNDETSGCGDRVWTIRCGACDATLRVSGARSLQHHAACASHTKAVASGEAPESKVATWIREHGDANKMTVVSNDEISGTGKCVRSIRCSACGTTLRFKDFNRLQKHAACAAHAAALEGVDAPESKLALWIREHGEAQKVTVLSPDQPNARGVRPWTVQCGACCKTIRVESLRQLQNHTTTAAHAAALEREAGVSTRPDAQRKRPRS
jgi:hypothetical protein